MNSKNVLYNTTFSVQLPYIADHSLQIQYQNKLNILVKCRNLDLCLLYGRKVINWCNFSLAIATLIQLKELSLCHKL